MEQKETSFEIDRYSRQQVETQVEDFIKQYSFNGYEKINAPTMNNIKKCYVAEVRFPEQSGVVYAEVNTTQVTIKTMAFQEDCDDFKALVSSIDDLALTIQEK